MKRTHGVTHWDPDDCFGCQLQTKSFAFPYGGREVFHGETIRERRDEMIREANAQGRDPQPVGTRWV